MESHAESLVLKEKVFCKFYSAHIHQEFLQIAGVVIKNIHLLPIKSLMTSTVMELAADSAAFTFRTHGLTS